MTPCFVQAARRSGTVYATEHGIASQDARPDARAIVSVGSLCELSVQWNASSVFFIGYALQLYWVYPMMTLWESLRTADPADVTPQAVYCRHHRSDL